MVGSVFIIVVLAALIDGSIVLRQTPSATYIKLICTCICIYKIALRVCPYAYTYT